ncbi:SpoIID/LytB domain-containing protein [Parablautia muri]|uniref:SpoIID/LytB domain-containing protein n=1 Tax=Parablautia muri TaxID=2320879 RepID=A0A9X5BDG5_9FIRM|nr:SpoIID/LytB domain-containing protein [Parablautia muri]NBJ91951.1 SpoIID/LytB domain-containing protein [Parablautia muri]
MKKSDRILVKVIAVVVLALLFIWLIYKDETFFQLEQPEGAFMPAGDVKILLDELVQAGAKGIDISTLREYGDRYLTLEAEGISYDTYCLLLECLLGKEGQSEKNDRFRDDILYKKKYKGEFLLLKEDWYDSYDKLIAFFGLEDVIRVETVEILCGNSALEGEKRLEDGCLLGRDGSVYTYASDQFAGLSFTSLRAYVHGERLLTLLECLPDEGSLKNVWIMEAEDTRIRFFYEGYEVLGEVQAPLGTPEQTREQVADLFYQNGIISRAAVKAERISGKLLGMEQGQIELEGYGKISIKESCVGYQLYEKLQKTELTELSIGYDFSDFVLEDGEVCAFLIARKEKMETIRVAIKSDNFSSLYHDRLILKSQDNMTVYYGPYEERKQKEILGGEELVLERDSDYFSGDRVEVKPEINTGKIEVLSLGRSQGTPAYRGSFEIVKTEDGLALINEILLEEYLYSVVPSEMPASYPSEALKAQAICARTYGYRYLTQPGYGQLGAHVDDSVSYQVYNNIAENIASTKAVKETAGMLLLYEQEPVSTYYYSTSCGFGADAGVWNEEQKEKMPYLSSVHIGWQDEEGEEPVAAELSQEENFRAYISLVDENAYEKDEAWFRWQYQVTELDVSLFYQRLKERYAAGANKVLTFHGKGEPEENPEDFEAKEPEKFKNVYEIQCFRRKEGGVMDELLVKTDKGTYKVISEYNIRYVLNQGGEIIRQDGSGYESAALLPSAYLIIDVDKKDENVVGYSIFGGGYGHGVGMSQNGAKSMGLQGLSCEAILSFYYTDCEIDKIY